MSGNETPWDLDTLTAAQAEVLFAEPLPANVEDPVFCEDELIAVYRRHHADLAAVLDRIAYADTHVTAEELRLVAAETLAKAKGENQ